MDGTRKLNILQVISGKTWSGGQQQTLHLLQGLRERGHNSFLACPPGSLLGDKAEDMGFQVFRIPMKKEADISSALQLYRLMKKERIDVVNAQRPTAHTLAMAAAYFAGVPAFVVTRRVSVRVNYISAKVKYSLVDKIISVSEGVKDVLVDCGISRDLISTVYSGTDLKRFDPCIDGKHIRDESGIPYNVPLIGAVGNVKDLKGQDEFVRAARLVLKEVPDARFILVGRGADNEFIEKIDKEMAPYFICTGFRKDIPEIFAAMDVHVNSATGFDGLAGTIREGLAMGKPTVATDVAGHREIIRDMETGLLVPLGDKEALAKAIVRLIKDKELASELAGRGREFVERNFTEEIMVERTEAVYLEILNKKGLL